jgi:hypothetical protein
MSQKRDYIDEIIKKKERSLRRVNRYTLFEIRLKDIGKVLSLAYALEGSTPLRAEVLKHIPVSIVASLEAYFRLLITNLIDSGNPFLERVSEFKDIRFGVDHVVALQAKKFLLGNSYPICCH